MNEKSTPKEPEEIISCDICLKEIPDTVANCMEGADYIHHYCGLECYKKWQETQKASPKVASK